MRCHALMTQTSIALTIATVTVAALIVMSWRAAPRLSALERLPMQWGLHGQPTWTAPRRLGLALMPTLGAIVMPIVAAMSPRPGQEAWQVPATLLCAAAFLGTHAYMLHRQHRAVDAMST